MSVYGTKPVLSLMPSVFVDTGGFSELDEISSHANERLDIGWNAGDKIKFLSVV